MILYHLWVFLLGKHYIMLSCCRGWRKLCSNHKLLTKIITSIYCYTPISARLWHDHHPSILKTDLYYKKLLEDNGYEMNRSFIFISASARLECFECSYFNVESDTPGIGLLLGLVSSVSDEHCLFLVSIESFSPPKPFLFTKISLD